MKNLLVLFILLINISVGTAQIGTNNLKMVTVHIETDQFGFETSWRLKSLDGTIYKQVNQGELTSNTTYNTTINVPNTSCLDFTINDAGSDGFLDGFGKFWVTLGNDTIAKNPSFTSEFSAKFNCQIGEICDKSIVIKTGNFQTIFPETWYDFKADSLGSYKISTCPTLENCDTKIYGYENCKVNDSTQVGTLFYADFSNECGLKADIKSIILEKNKHYNIKIASGEACKNTPIKWTIQYLGKPKGCTDSTACNYNPLAFVNDGSCLQFGNSSCGGPDLVIDQEQLGKTIKFDSIDIKPNDCTLKEGCLNGDGKRYLVRFNTKIWNKGDQDFFIADLNNPKYQQLLVFDACHQHVHYDNYAEYLLFDNKGKQANKGSKVGFQVRDLLCELNSTPKFNYNVFGISVGCFDEYDNGLPCQWLDVTSVPDGDYTLVVRVNWKKAADGLGRFEKNYDNNWGQLCIRLKSNANGRSMSVLPNCPTLQDCTGAPLGAAVLDCKNVCNGKAVIGDLDINGVQDDNDVTQYLSAAVHENTSVTPCEDLNNDLKISVTDAALLQDCLLKGKAHNHNGTGAHNHCFFGSSSILKADSIFYKILTINKLEKSFTIGLRNPYCGFHAFELKINGAKVIKIESQLSNLYTMKLKTSLQSNIIVGLMNGDFSLPKSTTYTPFLKVFYSDESSSICIDNSNLEAVNNNILPVIAIRENTCVQTTATIENEASKPQLSIYPNPANEVLNLDFLNQNLEKYSLDIYNTNGVLLQKIIFSESELKTFNISIFQNGFYYFMLKNMKTNQLEKVNKILIIK